MLPLTHFMAYSIFQIQVDKYSKVENQILGTHSATNAACFFVKQAHWFKNSRKKET